VSVPSQQEDEIHSSIVATRDAAKLWHPAPDGRLSHWAEPGIIDLKVSPMQLDRAFRIVQYVIDLSRLHGMEVRELQRARGQRPGIGIGLRRHLAAINVSELRHLVPFGELDLEHCDQESRLWWTHEEEFRERGYVARADGRLRLRLPRRYDRPPRGQAGWRFSFTDQVGCPLENQVEEIVLALRSRAARDSPSR